MGQRKSEKRKVLVTCKIVLCRITNCLLQHTTHNQRATSIQKSNSLSKKNSHKSTNEKPKVERGEKENYLQHVKSSYNITNCRLQRTIQQFSPRLRKSTCNTSNSQLVKTIEVGKNKILVECRSVLWQHLKLPITT